MHSPGCLRERSRSGGWNCRHETVTRMVGADRTLTTRGAEMAGQASALCHGLHAHQRFVAEHGLTIGPCVVRHNIDPKPFIRTASAKDILAKVTRANGPWRPPLDKYRTERRTAPGPPHRLAGPLGHHQTNATFSAAVGATSSCSRSPAFGSRRPASPPRWLTKRSCQTVALFFATALAEIVGCHLPHQPNRAARWVRRPPGPARWQCPALAGRW